MLRKNSILFCVLQICFLANLATARPVAEWRSYLQSYPDFWTVIVQQPHHPHVREFLDDVFNQRADDIILHLRQLASTQTAWHIVERIARYDLARGGEVVPVLGVQPTSTGGEYLLLTPVDVFRNLLALGNFALRFIERQRALAVPTQVRRGFTIQVRIPGPCYKWTRTNVAVTLEPSDTIPAGAVVEVDLHFDAIGGDGSIDDQPLTISVSDAPSIGVVDNRCRVILIAGQEVTVRAVEFNAVSRRFSRDGLRVRVRARAVQQGLEGQECVVLSDMIKVKSERIRAPSYGAQLVRQRENKRHRDRDADKDRDGEEEGQDGSGDSDDNAPGPAAEG